MPAAKNCTLTSVPLPIWSEAVKQGNMEGLSGAAVIERWVRDGAPMEIPTIEDWLKSDDAKEWFNDHRR